MQKAYNNSHQAPEYDETDPDVINVPIKQGGVSNLAMPGPPFKSDTLIHKIPIWQVISTQGFNNRLFGLSHGATVTLNIEEPDFKAMPPPPQMAAIFEEGRSRPHVQWPQKGGHRFPNQLEQRGNRLHGRIRAHSLSAAQGDRRAILSTVGFRLQQPQVEDTAWCDSQHG
jgi:hypothetical protein